VHPFLVTQQVSCAVKRFHGHLIVLALLWPTVASAQHGVIQGTVWDSVTATPIAVAVVRIDELHRQELTHQNGTFRMANMPPGNYELVVERIGYRAERRRVEVLAGSVASVEFRLSVSAVAVSPFVVITGALTRRAGEEVLSPTAVISGPELDRRSEPTVAGTLRSQPGVSVTALGPSTGRPVVRGLSGDRILVLEDGQRPGDMSFSSDHAVAIEPLTARQIEVVRGPMSLLYGSSALGGVINIVREEIPNALPEHVHGSFSMQGASVNTGGFAGGVANGALGQTAFRVEGSARLGRDIRTPVGKLENTDARTLNAALGIGRAGDWGHTGAAYRLYNNHYGIPGGFVGGHEHGVDIEMRRHVVRAEAELHNPIRSLEDARASLGFVSYRHVELENSGAIGTLFEQQMLNADLVARHGVKGISEMGAVGLRAQFRDITTGGSLRTPSTYDYNLALFLVEELGHGRTRAQLGLRYDHAHYHPRDTSAVIFAGGQFVKVRPRTFGSISGSFGILHELKENVRVGASLSRAYRTPDFNELYSNGPHLAANSFDVGDPELGQETGLGGDVFLRINQRDLQLEAALFVMELNDYIYPSSRGRVEFGTQGGRPRFQYTNEDARFLGAEGELEFPITRNWAVHGTASYVQARFNNPRDSLPVFQGTDTTFLAASKYPPLIPPLNGQLELRHDQRRFFGGAGVRFAAAQNRLGDFETATDGYVLVNADVGLRLLRGERLHSITLRVDNLLDTEYRDHLSRIKDIMPEPGINISLLYRLTF
jgi:iron complex outermembrane receptor protein